MIRSLRWGSALMLLALVGLAWGQTSSPTSPPGRMHTVSVQVPGKPAQVCKILKMWNEPDGSRAYQVEALDTGEWMTVLESAGVPSGRPGSSATSASTRVFRYGRSQTPPPGVPTPPVHAVTPDAGNLPPSGTGRSTVTTVQAGYPGPGSTPRYHTSSTAMPSMPTILIPPTPAGSVTTILPPTPVVSSRPSQPVSPGVSVPQNVPPVTAPVASTPALQPLPPETPVTVAAKPIREESNEWRKSWGSVETPQPARPLVSSPISAPQPTGGSEKMPVARNVAVDPLSQPGVYTKTPAKVEKGLGRPVETPASLAAQGPSIPTKTSMVTMPPVPAPQPTRPSVSPYAAPGAALPDALAPTVTASKPPVPTQPSPILSPTAAVAAATRTPSVPCAVCPTPATAPVTKPTPVTSTTTCIPCQQGAPATGIAGSPRLTPIPSAVVTQPKQLTPVVAEPKKPTPVPTPVVTVPKKPTPVPTPVVAEPKKPTPAPVELVKTPTPTPAPVTTNSGAKWNPFSGAPRPIGMRSVTAADSRELREDPQPVMVVSQEGRPLSVTPPANAFVEPVVTRPAPEGIANAFSNPTGAAPPIPLDRVRKDLMPPELVALLERQQREQGQGRPGMPMPPLPGNLPPEAFIAGSVPTAPTVPMTTPTPSQVQQVSGNAALDQLRATIQDGLLPSDREMAADQLATYDPYRTPTAVAILVTAARMDPATTVRVACVRAIGRMGAKTPDVMTTLQAIAREGDPQVQQAANEVLALIQARR